MHESAVGLGGEVPDKMQNPRLLLIHTKLESQELLIEFEIDCSKC